jgi:hypothetical protein
VERLLRDEPVSAFVLDLSLDPWSHRNILRLLLRLINEKENLEAEDEAKFHAYRLALLAHHRGVPCALLTNWQDFINPEKGVTEEAMRKVFHVNAIFGKEDLTPCAAWVKKQVSKSGA